MKPALVASIAALAMVQSLAAGNTFDGSFTRDNDSQSCATASCDFACTAAVNIVVSESDSGSSAFITSVGHPATCVCDPVTAVITNDVATAMTASGIDYNLALTATGFDLTLRPVDGDACTYEFVPSTHDRRLTGSTGSGSGVAGSHDSNGGSPSPSSSSGGSGSGLDDGDAGYSHTTAPSSSDSGLGEDDAGNSNGGNTPTPTPTSTPTSTMTSTTPTPTPTSTSTSAPTPTSTSTPTPTPTSVAATTKTNGAHPLWTLGTSMLVNAVVAIALFY